jgi:hypothetical protein
MAASTALQLTQGCLEKAPCTAKMQVVAHFGCSIDPSFLAMSTQTRIEVPFAGCKFEGIQYACEMDSAPTITTMLE